MNFDRNISIPQITWFVGGFLGLALAVMLGSAIGGHDFLKVGLVVGAFLGLGLFLALGKHYWMLIPFSLGAQFPAVPLGGRAIEFPELAIAGCSVFFLLRVATRKEQLHIFRSVNTPFLLFIGWVGMVFLLNPIGVALLGSSVGGGRFYLKLALAFAAFFILSNRTYSQQDIKWVLALLVFGAFFGMFYGMINYTIAGPQVNALTGMVDAGFYTWHQVLSGPAVTIAFLIFARWSPREVFGVQKPLLILAYFSCLLLVLFSGKRMGLAAVLLAPFISSIMYRQPRYIGIAAMLILGSLFTLVAGQGQWFKLPLVAQRALSWLPGDWDPELQAIAGGADEWRAELRYIAMASIQRDPWIGRGFAIDMQETMTAIGMQSLSGDIDIQVAAYALGRSWHNIWLGYAADFGIPFSVIQAALWLTVLYLSARLFSSYSNRTSFGVMGLYVFMFTCRDLMASWTSGHSSHDAFDRWWMYGIIVALYIQLSFRTQLIQIAKTPPQGPVT